jgi:ring-1,2-phenylacetyl-CoA epoxidase subunit PaaD
VTTATAPALDEVRRAVDQVLDPEMPAVTIGMLGMVHSVKVTAEGAVSVELLPTFAGCPATDVIREDVVAAAVAVPGVSTVSVRFRFDPPWTPARINAEGHEALRSFGIAPPLPGGPGGELGPGLPVVGITVRRTCPYCGSGDTDLDSSFGPTPCRSIQFCNACRQPFEAFKS